MLQTHYHIDHVNGTPQNSLLFNKHMHLRFFSPDLSAYNPQPEGTSLQTMESVIEGSYFNPRKGYWPVLPEELECGREYIPFRPGESCYFGERPAIKIETMPLNHKQGCCGFRINLRKHGPVVILTDDEPGLEADLKRVQLMDGAALAIVDMQFSDAQYDGKAPTGSMLRSRVGWGHGTPLRWFPNLLACKNPPKQVLITHHDPNHSDSYLDRFWEESRALLIKMFGRSLPFEYHFARGGQFYWL
jgi:hypothetical protein